MRQMFSRSELEKLLTKIETEAVVHDEKSSKLAEEYEETGSEWTADAEWQEEGISRGLRKAAELIEEMMRKPL